MITNYLSAKYWVAKKPSKFRLNKLFTGGGFHDTAGAAAKSGQGEDLNHWWKISLKRGSPT